MTAAPAWVTQPSLALLWQSALLGVGLGLLFDVFNAADKSRRRNRRLTFACDVLFFALAAVVTFYFALAVADGLLHPLLFVGSLGGFLAEHWLVGRYFSPFIYRSVRGVYRFLTWIFRMISVPLRAVFRAICRRLPPKGEKTAKNGQKNRKKGRFFSKNS